GSLTLLVSDPGEIQSIAIMNALGQKTASINKILYNTQGMVDLSQLVNGTQLKGIVYIMLTFKDGYTKMIKAVSL
ncbi:MAG TPA: hypothetical protein PLU49_03510, partial [Saprospiraceae bacterium]|nr:hypothetical protein [Saprospiraceae bacterium]